MTANRLKLGIRIAVLMGVLMPCMLSAASALPVKVVVVTMFEVGADEGTALVSFNFGKRGEI